MLRVYSTHTSCCLQVVGLAETRHRFQVLVGSLHLPVGLGWNAEHRLADDPMSVQNVFQNQDEN